MAEKWKQEHRFLYNTDGSPTKDLEKLREQDQPPQGDDLSNRFPTVQVSLGFHTCLNRYRNAVQGLARAREGGTPEHDTKIKVLYGVMQDAAQELYEYVEQLEYAAGIPRNVVKRF